MAARHLLDTSVYCQPLRKSRRFPVLDVTSEVARMYAAMAGPLIREGRTRPVVDLLIAATAKSAGLVLATLNPRHFEGLEGLAVEDWSK